MNKPKTFRPWQPGQTSLLPPSPSDWLTADHQVYFLLDQLLQAACSQFRDQFTGTAAIQ
jgi:hypothetical protein